MKVVVAPVSAFNVMTAGEMEGDFMGGADTEGLERLVDLIAAKYDFILDL